MIPKCKYVRTVEVSNCPPAGSNLTETPVPSRSSSINNYQPASDMDVVPSGVLREEPTSVDLTKDTNCRLMAYHEPYLEVVANNNTQQQEFSQCQWSHPLEQDSSSRHTVPEQHHNHPVSLGMRMRRATRPVATMWSEIVNNSVISIILCTVLLASQFTVIAAINAVAEGETNSNAVESSFGTRSMFTTKNNTSIIAQRGGVAVLPCSVQLNSQATVSWIRRQDYKLLTVAQENLSSDERFVSDFGKHLGLASLRIKNVRESDKGLYECQLSSYPPQSLFVKLKISEVTTEIGDGGTDIHIDEGSQLRLECKLRYVTEIPTFVFWYFGDRMINYDLDEGYLVEDLSKYYNSTSTSSNFNTNLVISTLIVESVNKKHLGNYSCSPSNAKSAQVTVHVLHDEKPAAMQHANGGNNVKLNLTAVRVIALFVIGVLNGALS